LLSNRGQRLRRAFTDDEAVKDRGPDESVEAVTSVYSGNRRHDGTTVVRVNGRPLDPRPGFRSHPVTTFDWGYEGRGGPAQLALAILADHFGDDDERARWLYEDFTRRVIRGLPRGSWVLTGAEIDAALPKGGH
jgi:hypothetical protein